MNPLLLCDYYKTEHFKMYPKNMTKLYSNFTPRKSRIKGIDKVVFFGLQHFCIEYLIHNFNKYFFSKEFEDIKEEYIRHINVNTDHICRLWHLGFLPIEIKSLEEGGRSNAPSLKSFNCWEA